jgi:kinesin family protein 5
MVFQTIQELKNMEFTIMCSYSEIYQEMISDLLDPTKQDLEIREHPTKGIFVDGLTWEFVTSGADIYRLIAFGDAHKVKRYTKMNPNSSRSHGYFCIRLEKKELETGRVAHTLLNLVDLAGSERVNKSGAATGLAFEEVKKINLSLTALSQCINALTDGKLRTHIPYRQSKLTRLLQDSLGGNAKTSVLIACSPHLDNFAETLDSLRFAQRCANVKNSAVVNVQVSEEELKELIESLKKELEKAKQKTKYARPEMSDSITQTDANDEVESSPLEANLMEKQVWGLPKQ